MNVCRYVPGSEQWYIQRVASRTIKNDGLQPGEKLVFINGIRRMYAYEWQGQPCKYAAVKYAVKEADSSKTHRIIHLLLTENCKRTLDVSLDGKADWVQSKDLKALNALLNSMGL